MTTDPGTPIDRLLTWFLLVAPLSYLAADGLYALNGWDDPTAGVLAVLASVAYAFLFLRLVTFVHTAPGWAAALLVVGMLGVAGSVAYGFDTIHVSMGDPALVDSAGAANLIKPLGLFFPAGLLVAAGALWSTGTGPRWAAALLGIAGLAWPVAHIANIAPLAVLVNAALVAVGVALFRQGPAVQGTRDEAAPAAVGAQG